MSQSNGRRFGVSISSAALVAALGAAVSSQPVAAQTTAGPGTVAGVVVTASPLGGDPDRFATIVQQIRRSDILGMGGANLADALRDTPGVAGTGFAAGASRPVIRGMDAQRVKIVENGLSSSDASDVGPDHGVPIDPLAAQSIEVVRGAATLRYGSQAIGGVVNAFNNRIPMNRIEGLKGESSAAYESNAATGEGSALIDAGSGDFAVHLDGFGRRSSSYETPLGVQSNSYFKGRGYSAGGSYFFGAESRLGGAYTHYQARYGIPAGDTYIDMRQNKAALGSSLKSEGATLQKIDLDAGYADYSHSEIDPADGAVLATFKNKEWDGRAEALFGQIGPFTGSAVGLQLQDRKFEALGEAADYLSPTHSRSAAGFVFAEAPFGPLAFQGAARVERLTIDGAPASGIETRRSFSPVSLSAGFTYDLSDTVRLGLTAASAARAPAQTELFAKGPHDGPSTYETGDPDLGIERANSLEGTLRLRFSSGARLDGSVWGARFEDYIYGRLTGRFCDESGVCGAGPEPLKEMNYAQRNARFWGAELKGSIPLGQVLGGALSANLLADYVRAEFSNGGGDIPRIQPGRAGGGLAWTSNRLDASFLILAVADQTRVGAGDTPTPGYTSVDAQLAWRPWGEARRIEILLVGHNLADEEVRNATALNKDDVVMPGRNLRLVLRTRF
jgi:iron complex outermembrane receptor protein